MLRILSIDISSILCQKVFFIGIVVAVAFQITFHVKIHVNNIFFIFLKLFLTSTHQNNLKI